MSRLEKHQNKQIFQRIAIAFVLFIAFIVFFFSVGIKMLVSFTLFLNQLANSGSKQQTSQQTESFNSVNIDPIPSATNSANLTFSGTSLNFDKLEIYLNDEKQDEISISDSFSGEVKGLEKGTNTVHFIAKSSSSKEIKKTPSYDILYKSDKPKLEVQEPNDNTKTNKEDIKISGLTDKETTIRVNGQPLIVDVGGKFTTMFRLKDGENKIQITAEDIVGNQEKKDLTITYSKDE
ncbi:MAG: hypothetical protein NTZ55_02565 [Candidatus Roizmanbacteria bacterium]|nr:hypothetical protein [Candidatus Roizmanbacteria bacterium]